MTDSNTGKRKRIEIKHVIDVDIQGSAKMAVDSEAAAGDRVSKVTTDIVPDDEREEVDQSEQQCKQAYLLPSFSSKRSLLIFFIAVICGCTHWYHQSTLFENDLHFSHLSTMEREMSFRSEMGLYYSYFKTLIESPDMFSGLHAIMHDNTTEYPNSINTLQRFNLYPEIVLALLFRTYIFITDSLEISTKICWQVNRGNNLPPVLSCEGFGEPAVFYVNIIFIWNGVLMSLIFLYGLFLSDSILGGLLSVLWFFYNHAEATRVQWTPPLRESFAYPIFVAQMLFLSYCLRLKSLKERHVMSLAILNMLFIICWQFAQFAFLTQVFCLHGLYLLQLVSYCKVRRIYESHLLGLILSVILLFGNKMLFTSIFPAYVLSSYLAIAFNSWTVKCGPPILKFAPFFLTWGIQALILGISTIVIKWFLSTLMKVQDDAHVFSLLLAKFFSYKDFHTQLYLCAKEFDFLEWRTMGIHLQTALLPTCIFIIGFYIMKSYFTRCDNSNETKEPHKTKSSNRSSVYEPEIIYNFLQGGAFAVLAFLFMRLKLFYTPHLCLIGSLAASKKILGKVMLKEKQLAVLSLLVALMSYYGIDNIAHQRRILGEYNNLPQEKLFEWIKKNTRPNAVFAGAMSTMANLKLSTGRAVVNHPHYESADLRERTKKVYSLYSRKSADDVFNILKGMGVDYAIVEREWCTKASKSGCSLPDIWNIEDKANQNYEPVCNRIYRNPYPFVTVYREDQYSVLRI